MEFRSSSFRASGEGAEAAPSREVSPNGYALPLVNAPPSISLRGANPLAVGCGCAFVDRGATACDPCEGDLTSRITVAGSVNVNAAGANTLTYTVTDADGKSATATRTENVACATPR